MVNKSINDLLDSHFDRVNCGVVVKKKKVTKNLKNKSAIVCFLKAIYVIIKTFFLKIKNYLFPEVQFESVEISDFGTTIVSSIDKGIKFHYKLFKSILKSIFVRKKPVRVDEEDVDVRVIKDVIRQSTLNKK